MKAKMILPYGAYAQGETVRGATAKQLCELGVAVQLHEPKPEKKPAAKAKKKDLGAAPENKKQNLAIIGDK